MEKDIVGGGGVLINVQPDEEQGQIEEVNQEQGQGQDRDLKQEVDLGLGLDRDRDRDLKLLMRPFLRKYINRFKNLFVFVIITRFRNIITFNIQF